MKGALLGALIYLTAAAAGVILHAATVAGHTGIATATEQNQKNDDPAAVAAAEEAVRTHAISSFPSYITYYCEWGRCVTKRFA